MIKLTHSVARDRFPGAIETWIMLVLEQRPQDYADEREVLRHTTVWICAGNCTNTKCPCHRSEGVWDDSGTLVLGWQVEGRNKPSLTRWNSEKLEWADDPDTIEFMQNHVV